MTMLCCTSKLLSAATQHGHFPAAMQLVLLSAGPLFNNEGVLLHVGATIIWSDGRRANFQCGFDQALTQYLEVSCHLVCCTLHAQEQSGA